MKRVSIIIPAHNEERRIGKTLGAYGKYFDKLVKDEEIEYEILVVINNTTDKTEEIVKKAQSKNRRVKYLNLKPGGKGFAVIEGFKDALKRENELIGFVDADLATSPEEFYKLIKNIGSYGGIIASRSIKGALVKTPLLRKMMRKGFNFLVRSILFLSYRDTQCGAKLFTSKIVRELMREKLMTQWAFDIDLLLKLKKKSIKEFPTIWEDKDGSKIKFLTPIKMFASIIRLRLVYSPLRFIVRLYDKLPERIKVHSL